MPLHELEIFRPTIDQPTHHAGDRQDVIAIASADRDRAAIHRNRVDTRATCDGAGRHPRGDRDVVDAIARRDAADRGIDVKRVVPRPAFQVRKPAEIDGVGIDVAAVCTRDCPGVVANAAPRNRNHKMPGTAVAKNHNPTRLPPTLAASNTCKFTLFSTSILGIKRFAIASGKIQRSNAIINMSVPMA